jgi:hypothetical protein
MAEEAAPEEPAAVRPIEVVAKDAVPNERFDVEVDRIGAPEELHGLFGDSELSGGVRDVHPNASLTRQIGDRCDPDRLAANRQNFGFVNRL